jgi:hypothetical protein
MKNFLPFGRLLGWSKSTYMQENPGHKVVFNGNICTKSSGKIWYGDLDLTIDNEALEALAKSVGEPIYILNEHDGRFDRAKNPLLEMAVKIIKG